MTIDRDELAAQDMPARLVAALHRAPLVPEDLIDRDPALLRLAMTHRAELTPAELKVVTCLSHGLTLLMAAEVLGKSLSTVKDQAGTARAVLNAKTTTHLVAIAFRQGLIE